MLWSMLVRQSTAEACQSQCAGSGSSPCDRTILVALGVALLAMSACATQAQRQAETITAGIQESYKVAKSCFDSVTSSFAHTNLYHRFPPPPVSLAHLADTTFPSGQDRQDLIAYHTATLPCRTQMLDDYKRFAPRLAAVQREYFDILDVIYLRLAEGSTSYGEANRAKAELDTLYERAWQEAVTAMDRDLAAAQQAELQQRAAAAMALQQWSYQQQVLNSLNRPTTTNCSVTGGFINCQSY
jgi:hypothetical protein